MQNGELVQIGTGCEATNDGRHIVEDHCRQCGGSAGVKAELDRLTTERDELEGIVETLQGFRAERNTAREENKNLKDLLRSCHSALAGWMASGTLCEGRAETLYGELSMAGCGPKAEQKPERAVDKLTRVNAPHDVDIETLSKALIAHHIWGWGSEIMVGEAKFAELVQALTALERKATDG